MAQGRELLERVRRTLWSVDDEWSEDIPRGFRWWAHRLEQRLTHLDVGDHTRLAASVHVLNGAYDLVAAVGLCNELNRHTAGYAWVSEVDGSVSSCCSVDVGPGDVSSADRWVEAALDSLWQAELFGDRMASVLHAQLASGGPAGVGLRPSADEMLSVQGFYRARPEWGDDPRTWPMRDPDRILALLLDDLRQRASAVRLEDVNAQRGTFSLSCILPIRHPKGHGLAGQISGHIPQAPFGFGRGYTAQLSVPLRASLPELAALTNMLNQRVLTGHAPGSLAAWYSDPNGLTHISCTPDSALRKLITHEASVRSEPCLVPASATAALLDNLPAEVPFVPREWEPTPLPFSDGAAYVMDAITAPATNAMLEDEWSREGSDERLLWGDIYLALGTWGIVNPAGPTQTELGLLRHPSGDGYVLVSWMRHPFSPDYRLWGRVRDDNDLRARLGDMLPQILGSVPEFVDLRFVNKPHVPIVTELLKQAVLRSSAERGENLGEAAFLLDYFHGDAWARITANETPPVPPCSEQEAVERWWAAATTRRNIAGHRAALSAAWDGAIALLRGAAP